MIAPKDFYNALAHHGLDFYAGVPDSLLKHFCAYVADHSAHNIIAANEGNAVAIACGYYLTAKKPAVVYMQNSGIGNAVNPLLSLADKNVYRIPLLLLIGWRGEPGVKDEPQHITQGQLTLDLLRCLDIHHTVIDADTDIHSVINDAYDFLSNERIYALVIRKGTFHTYTPQRTYPSPSSFTKEHALTHVIDAIGSDAYIISTTGKLSRELFELREKRNETHSRDFLTVGSMGHTSQIALGAALGNTRRTFYCLDGDGSFLMHMGSTAVNASLCVPNLKHIVFNNGAHDSVGGQPTAARHTSLSAVATACGYKNTRTAANPEELAHAITSMRDGKCDFLEILVDKGARADLGRPTQSPQTCKQNFMDAL